MENVTKSWSNLWIGKRQVVSEERLQEVPHIKLIFKTKFHEVKNLIYRKLLDWQEPEQT